MSVSESKFWKIRRGLGCGIHKSKSLKLWNN